MSRGFCWAELHLRESSIPVMIPVRRRLLLAVGILALAPVTFVVLAASGTFNYEVWTRDNPLVSSIAVTTVSAGKITLADGRTFRPAGVTRSEEISPADYDLALSAIAAQGVVVNRDFGDGRAFLQAEPKFYNWCGTRGYKGNPFGRWGGIYVQCPLSEALIHSGYAKPDLGQAGLSPSERWRLEGTAQVRYQVSSPIKVSTAKSLRYDASLYPLEHLDGYIELTWKPPPPPHP